MNLNFSYSHLTRLLAACVVWIGWASSLPAEEIQGFTEPYQDIEIATADTGIIEAIPVKEGDRVVKDQLLVRMDAAVLEVTAEIAKSIKESRGRLESAAEELELQTKMVGKLEELRLRQHASPQELQRAQTQKRIAEARLKAVREELDVNTLEHQRARVQLERCRLRSPIDGLVTRIFKDQGESVSLSDPVIVKVVQLDPLLVIFLVPADSARNLTVEQAVGVRIPEIAKTTQGAVEFVSPTTDPQSGLTRVRVRLPNPEERLPCGATCYLILSANSSSRLTSTER